MDIIGKKWLYFALSGIVIIPGLISLLLFGLRYSIEFTGGTLLEVKLAGSKVKGDTELIKLTVENEGVDVASIQTTSQDTFLLRTKPIDKSKSIAIEESLRKKFQGEVIEERFETVGPTIGKELTQKAILAVITASIAIIVYIALAFHKVPKPASPWRFGICAVLALIHDVLVVVGVFSLLGHFYKVEIDALFVTAILTVIGFSVHDTIVVFDRIRENLRKMTGQTFAEVVNESIIQTLARSLSTSLTVIFTLLALFLFSTGSLRWFVVALLVGIITGTYSSIFNASPLLVVWQEWSAKRALRK